MDLEPFVFSRDGYVVGMRSKLEASTATAGGAGPADNGELLAQVNGFALRPLTADEFVVFTMDLCHNQMDRHFSRFPDEELEKINKMVPGRPLMERHDLRGSLPRGTFFRSVLHSDEARGRLSVRPDVYVLRTPDNSSFIQNIEGGVYRETSIGFSFKTPECAICGKDLRTCDHVPGRTSVWDRFQGNSLPMPGGSAGIGTPDDVREALRVFEEAGVDQAIFIQQGGNNRHADICAALELFATDVMPEFRDRHEARQRQKAERLAPAIERALARRTAPPDPAELPVVRAYGRNPATGATTYPKG
jgi:hypothetical protein